MLAMDGHIHRFQLPDVSIRRKHPTKMRIADPIDPATQYGRLVIAGCEDQHWPIGPVEAQ
jgi:hypothetical protein